MKQCNDCQESVQERLVGTISAIELVARMGEGDRAHLERCPECREALTEAVRLHERLAWLAVPPSAVPDLRAGVLAALTAEPPAPVVRESGSSLVLLAAAVAALAYFATPFLPTFTVGVPEPDPLLLEALLVVLGAVYAFGWTAERREGIA